MYRPIRTYTGDRWTPTRPILLHGGGESTTLADTAANLRRKTWRIINGGK